MFNSKTKTFGLTLLTLVLFASLVSAYNVSGVVRDDCTGNLVVVPIQIAQSGYSNSTTTAADGYFNLGWDYAVATSMVNYSNGTAQVYVGCIAGWQCNATTVTVAGDTEANFSVDQAHCVVYASTDVGSMVVDLVGGVLAPLGQAANPIAWAVFAGIIATIVFAMIATIRQYGK